MLTDPYQHM